MEENARNIQLIVEYNGANFYGWQRQEALPTVQGCLESALNQILGEVPPMVAAGRTDAGVHALGQVINFRTTSAIEGWKFAPALNRFLPVEISVHRSQQVHSDFNARNDSLSKKYRYRIYEGPQRSALEHQRAWPWRSPIDVLRIEEAATHLVGEHDFESFRHTECDAEHAIREMFDFHTTAVKENKIDDVKSGRYRARHGTAAATCRPGLYSLLTLYLL